MTHIPYAKADFNARRTTTLFTLFSTLYPILFLIPYPILYLTLYLILCRRWGPSAATGTEAGNLPTRGHGHSGGQATAVVNSFRRAGSK